MTALDRPPELLLPASETLAEANARIEQLRALVSSLLTLNDQLQNALDSRIVIEQAKGVLAERYELSADDAFVLLRRSARNHRMRLHALAAAVVASRETPNEITPPSA